MHPVINIQAALANVWAFGSRPVMMVTIPLGMETQRYSTDTPSLWCSKLYNMADSTWRSPHKYHREMWGVETPWFYSAEISGYAKSNFSI